jgi:hypothetical protein
VHASGSLESVRDLVGSVLLDCEAESEHRMTVRRSKDAFGINGGHEHRRRI